MQQMIIIYSARDFCKFLLLLYLTNLSFWLNKHKNNQSFAASTKYQIQLILEKHGSELCGSTHVWVFLTSKYCMVPHWLNPWMGNCGCWTLNMEKPQLCRVDYKLYKDFRLHGGGSAPLILGCSRSIVINIMGSTTKFLFYKTKFMRMKQLKKKHNLYPVIYLLINNFDYINY